jgi:hypothetical protein
MSLPDLSGVAEKLLSPAHRDRLDRTLFGSLLGQSVVLLVTVALYLATLALLYRSFRADLPAFREDFGDLGLWAFVLAPVVAIIAFSLIPTTAQAWRQARLRRLSVDLTDRKPGAFRLSPYGARDADDYRRPDGADEAAFKWLGESRESLLYLSGASGAGKSSLLEASVLPRLREKGWETLSLRVYADPETALREALLARKDLFQAPPARNAALSTLLARAAQERVRTGSPPLLLLIDQFEEFLILNDAEARKPLIALFCELAHTPLPGLRLLCVFRSDYRELLFKLGLPAYVSGRNVFDVPAFFRPEAEAFLGGSGLVLSPEGYAALFAGLDRVEDTPRLYRPITLNMVGLVIERMGRRIDADPERLIATYLRDCLAAGRARDFAPRVLGAIITPSGTKQPRDVATLADETRLEPWQVESTLADLETQGLLRPLDKGRQTWEISHDFLARQIALTLNRLRRPWLRRAAPIVLPAAGIGWAAAIFLLFIWWPAYREAEAYAGMREVDFVQVAEDGRQFFSPLNPFKSSDEDLQGFADFYERIRNPPTQLDLTNAPGDHRPRPAPGHAPDAARPLQRPRDHRPRPAQGHAPDAARPLLRRRDHRPRAPRRHQPRSDPRSNHGPAGDPAGRARDEMTRVVTEDFRTPTCPLPPPRPMR